MKKSVIYIANFLSEEIMKERDNRDFFSPAANNKILAIAKSLETQGFRIFILCPSLSKNNSFRRFRERKETWNENIEMIYARGLDLTVLNRFYSIFSEVGAIRRLLKNNEVEGIIFYDFIIETAIAALISKILYRMKIVVDYEEDLYLKNNPFSFYRTFLLYLRRIMIKFIDGAILVSSKLVKYSNTKNYSICRGFYTDFERDEMQDQRNVVPVITFGGKMDEFRGVNLLLKSIPHIKFKCKLCLTGYGPDLEKFRDVAQFIKSDYVEIDFKGFVTAQEYQDIVIASDILINTQLIKTESSETLFPSKIIEYMSTGKIVISSNISDVETIAEGRIVLYYKDTAEDISDAINKVLNNLDRYREYGKNARAYCKENFNYEKYGEEFSRLFMDK